MQYGIRLRTVDDMPYNEFCSYLSGIMPDTPLGSVVSIRSETDKDILDGFTKDQRRIRNEWLNKQAQNKTPQETEQILNNILAAFKNLAGEGGENND
jgi:hypothetical protein